MKMNAEPVQGFQMAICRFNSGRKGVAFRVKCEGFDEKDCTPVAFTVEAARQFIREMEKHLQEIADQKEGG